VAKKPEKQSVPAVQNNQAVGSQTSQTKAPRELVLLASPAAALRAHPRGLTSTAGADIADLTQILAAAKASLRPLFGDTEVRLRTKAAHMVAAGVADVPDLSHYYRVDAPDDQLDALAQQLRGLDTVHAAYVKPSAEPPVRLDAQPAASAQEPPLSTPDFSSRQGYLDAAPGGIDARYAWTQRGGSGTGVNIIDIEGEWNFTHEDLLQNQGGMVGGDPAGNLGWRNHGTAVIGEFGGDRNDGGITGICPEANVRAISIFGNLGSAGAIRRAADMLNPGDIILIELHRPGPRFNFAGRADQRGYICVEWWPDDFDAIRYATARGVVVVEAAGNGAEDLDDAIYDTPGQGFPAGWVNPLRRSRDSGAILVGAGAPPPGTHGNNHGEDRSRLDFSNHGSAVDAQGWGREVTTSAYGDLQGGQSENLWYTDTFGGTSSASPIVVGALACMQGTLRVRGKALLTPATARNLLRETGSAQQDGANGPATQRIGNRPDLRQMMARYFGDTSERVPLYRYWNPTVGDHFYTTNWSELENGRYGWLYEGVLCDVYPKPVFDSVPLYRYWNAKIGDHFYTVNWQELGAGRDGWVFEGIQCHVFVAEQSGSVPLHRYWNAKIGDHFYTTNWQELQGGAHGWNYEGVACHVFAHATTPLSKTGAGVARSACAPNASSFMTLGDTAAASFVTESAALETARALLKAGEVKTSDGALQATFRVEG
jgi:Subtilase family/Repeat of unknown function (DUF5648)